MDGRINLEYLQIAKALTGSSDIDYLIEAARKIEQYAKSGEPVPLPTFLDFVNSTCIPTVEAPKGQRWEPYPHQLEMVSAAQEHNRCLFLTARQIGSTTALAAYAVYEAITKPDSVIMFCEFQHARAVEIINRILFMIDHSSFPMPRLTERMKGEIKFENGSRIFGRAVSESAAKGMSLSHLIVSDAAYLPPQRAQDFWHATWPCVALYSKIIVQSTPRAAEGLFYDLWQNAERHGFRALSFPHDVIKRDAAWVEEMKARIGERAFVTEFENQFLDRLPEKS
jgi:hypothetical protein